VQNRRPLYTIALTGHIASGKSTAMKLFQDLGAYVLSADSLTHGLLSKNEEVISAIKHHFGKAVCNAEGSIDRNALGRLVFTSGEDRMWLESVLHPKIQTMIHDALLNNHQYPYAIVEIPVLRNIATYPYINRVLLITSYKKNLIERTLNRNTYTKSHIRRIIDAQPSLETLRSIADDIIANNSDMETFVKKVKKIHAQYLQQANLHS
jgi:dephospho-CoA kinase